MATRRQVSRENTIKQAISKQTSLAVFAKARNAACEAADIECAHQCPPPPEKTKKIGGNQQVYKCIITAEGHFIKEMGSAAGGSENRVPEQDPRTVRRSGQSALP